LIPCADTAQAAFEAEIFDRVGYGICPQDLDSGARQPFGLRSLSPAEDKLELSLANCDGSFEAFISKISPCLHTDGADMSGVPGLRVDFDDSGATLRRLQAPGIVVLRGVDRDGWNEALRKSFEDPEMLVSFYLGGASALHEVEKFHIANYTLECRSVLDSVVAHRILSGILRRAFVFSAKSQMRFTDLWFNFLRDRVLVNIEWAGDLCHYDVIRDLLDKRFGLPLQIIPGEDCHCEPCTVDTYAINLKDSISGIVELSLRRSHLYRDVLPKRKSGPCELAWIADKGVLRLRRGLSHAY
jgi:hypothetical protein